MTQKQSETNYQFVEGKSFWRRNFSPKPYPTYKDSGVSWLGDVPAHWKMERGKWLFERMQRPIRQDDETVTCFRDGMVTLRKNRRTSGFTESLQEIGYQGVRRGDLVIHAMDAFAGAVGVSDSDGKCTPVYAVCQPKRPLNTHFYAYIVREMSRTQYIVALSRGIRQRSTDFRFETFANQELPVPPFDDQEAIAAFLLHHDRLTRRYIHAQQRLIKLLTEQKQALIQQAVTRGLDPAAPLKDSGIAWLGKIPAHWETVRLKDVVYQIIDTEHKTAPFYENGQYLVVRTSNVKNGKLVFDDAKYTDEAGFQEWTRRGIPRPGDILFTREAPAGEACLVPSDVPLCLGQRVVLFRVNQTRLNPHFGLFSIYGGAAAKFIQLLSLGSTVAHFNMSDIGCIPILLPPLKEQQEIANFVENDSTQIMMAITHAQRQIALIREYRTRLIADVVTGKMDVRGVVLPTDEEADAFEDVGADFDDEATDADDLEAGEVANADDGYQ